ncbi:PolC-type DNA polymerase III [Verrucomicrobiota bacterium]
MNFIAFDTETTGIKPGQDRIIELGAVKFINGEPGDRFETLINPGVPIPPGASRVNGITDDMVADAPKIETKLDEFAAFCGDMPLVAHNAPFDFKFIKAAIETHRSQAPKGTVLDSCELARKMLPNMINYKLGTLVAHFQFPTTTFHRAADDAVYCGLLFQRLIEMRHKLGEPVSVADIVKVIGKAELKLPQLAPATDQLDLFG